MMFAWVPVCLQGRSHGVDREVCSRLERRRYTGRLRRLLRNEITKVTSMYGGVLLGFRE